MAVGGREGIAAAPLIDRSLSAAAALHCTALHSFNSRWLLLVSHTTQAERSISSLANATPSLSAARLATDSARTLVRECNRSTVRHDSAQSNGQLSPLVHSPAARFNLRSALRPCFLRCTRSSNIQRIAFSTLVNWLPPSRPAAQHAIVRLQFSATRLRRLLIARAAFASPTHPTRLPEHRLSLIE